MLYAVFCECGRCCYADLDKAFSVALKSTANDIASTVTLHITCLHCDAEYAVQLTSDSAGALSVLGHPWGDSDSKAETVLDLSCIPSQFKVASNPSHLMDHLSCKFEDQFEHDRQFQLESCALHDSPNGALVDSHALLSFTQDEIYALRYSGCTSFDWDAYDKLYSVVHAATEAFKGLRLKVLKQ